MTEGPIFATLVAAAFFVATQAASQDLSEALRSTAQDYVDEMIIAAQNQARLGKDETDPGYTALLAEDERWMNPWAKIGIGPVTTHMALYSATRGAAGHVTLAQEAARVDIALSYDEFPNLDWPAEVDFILVEDEWWLRAVRLGIRRPLPVTASPADVLATYVDQMQHHLARRDALDDDSWTRQNLGRNWTLGGGGYWRWRKDCKKVEADICLKARLGSALLWSTLALDREKTVEIGDISGGPDAPAAEIVVIIKRHTMVEERKFAVSFLKDKRHGWQISELTKNDETVEPDAVDLTVDASNGTALVASLLKAMIGPEAPDSMALMADPSILDPYFADTRDGQKAAAKVMTLKSMLPVFGIKAENAVYETLPGGQVQVSFKDVRATAPTLVFSIANDASGAKITAMESR